MEKTVTYDRTTYGPTTRSSCFQNGTKTWSQEKALVLLYEIIPGLYGHREFLTLLCSYLGIGINNNKPFTSLKEIMRVGILNQEIPLFTMLLQLGGEYFVIRFPFLLVEYLTGLGFSLVFLFLQI